jgi:hypothetical protein
VVYSPAREFIAYGLFKRMDFFPLLAYTPY